MGNPFYARQSYLAQEIRCACRRYRMVPWTAACCGLLFRRGVQGVSLLPLPCAPPRPWALPSLAYNLATWLPSLPAACSWGGQFLKRSTHRPSLPPPPFSVCLQLGRPVCGDHQQTTSWGGAAAVHRDTGQVRRFTEGCMGHQVAVLNLHVWPRGPAFAVRHTRLQLDVPDLLSAAAWKHQSWAGLHQTPCTPEPPPVCLSPTPSTHFISASTMCAARCWRLRTTKTRAPRPPRQVTTADTVCSAWISAHLFRARLAGKGCEQRGSALQGKMHPTAVRSSLRFGR